MLFITEEKYKLAKQLKECIGELQQVAIMLVGRAAPILYWYQANTSIFGGIGIGKVCYTSTNSVVSMFYLLTFHSNVGLLILLFT